MGARCGSPSSSSADTATPIQPTTVTSRSEKRAWNRLGARQKSTRARKRGTGTRPRSPSSGRNCVSTAANATGYVVASMRSKTQRDSQPPPEGGQLSGVFTTASSGDDDRLAPRLAVGEIIQTLRRVLERERRVQR